MVDPGCTLRWPRVLLVLLCISCVEKRVVEGFPEEFSGIGIELTMDDGLPAVGRVLPNSPAADADMRPGDRFLSVNGKSCRELQFGAIVVALRGAAGTAVELEIGRSDAVFNLVLHRKRMVRQEIMYR